MSWTKLSDDFSDDCWTLSDAAFRLHVEALVWSNRKLLNCRIPKDEVRRFAKHPEKVPELLAIDWWVEEEDVFVLRHHASYQRSREAVLRQQEVNKANRAKGKARPTKGTGAPRELAPTPPRSDDSSNDSTDERDWTGLVGSGSTYKSESFVANEDAGEYIDEQTGEVIPLGAKDPDPVDPWAADGNSSLRRCPGCEGPLKPGQVRHPACRDRASTATRTKCAGCGEPLDDVDGTGHHPGCEPAWQRGA